MLMESSGFVTNLYALTQFNTNELTLTLTISCVLRFDIRSVRQLNTNELTLTITATATATNQPESLHCRGATVLGNNSVSIGSVPRTPFLTGTHHWWSGAGAVRSKLGYRVQFPCLYALFRSSYNTKQLN